MCHMHFVHIYLLMLHEPHSLLRKYCREWSSVPQDSRPVEMTPGIIITGWCAVMPCLRACRPTEKES